MLVSFLKDRYAKPARFFGESFIVHGAIKGNLTVVFVDQRGGNIEKWTEDSRMVWTRLRQRNVMVWSAYSAFDTWPQSPCCGFFY